MKQEYHRALEQICLSEEARARIISVLEQKERGLKRPRRRIGRLILVCAVLILLLLGTGAAVVSRVGVLELFFQGDTSQLEPFVQTGASAQDKNYRLTLDSSICDGDTLYVVITVDVNDDDDSFVASICPASDLKSCPPPRRPAAPGSSSSR